MLHSIFSHKIPVVMAEMFCEGRDCVLGVTHMVVLYTGFMYLSCTEFAFLTCWFQWCLWEHLDKIFQFHVVEAALSILNRVFLEERVKTEVVNFQYCKHFCRFTLYVNCMWDFCQFVLHGYR